MVVTHLIALHPHVGIELLIDKHLIKRRIMGTLYGCGSGSCNAGCSGSCNSYCVSSCTNTCRGTCDSICVTSCTNTCINSSTDNARLESIIVKLD